MKIRVASDLSIDSIVDGPGLRTVIWTQGCIHNCPGCHNISTQSFDAGALIEVEEVIEALEEVKIFDGVTFSGGEPMHQAKACSIISKYLKERNINIWCYTGYTFEELIELGNKNKYIVDFLNSIDVLVDGKFLDYQKDLKLNFRGSTNQRIIDVKKSLKLNKITIIDKYDSYAENASNKKIEGIYT